MPRDADDKPEEFISDEEATIERVLASLKWLAEACQQVGLPSYAELIDEAFSKSLQRYVSEQRELLAKTYGRGKDDKGLLN